MSLTLEKLSQEDLEVLGNITERVCGVFKSKGNVLKILRYDTKMSELDLMAKAFAIAQKPDATDIRDEEDWEMLVGCKIKADAQRILLVDYQYDRVLINDKGEEVNSDKLEVREVEYAVDLGVYHWDNRINPEKSSIWFGVDISEVEGIQGESHIASKIGLESFLNWIKSIGYEIKECEGGLAIRGGVERRTTKLTDLSYDGVVKKVLAILVSEYCDEDQVKQNIIRRSAYYGLCTKFGVECDIDMSWIDMFCEIETSEFWYVLGCVDSVIKELTRNLVSETLNSETRVRSATRSDIRKAKELINILESNLIASKMLGRMG